MPAPLLPKVVDCSGEFGVATADILGAPVPVLGMAGDQQAATVGQACIKPGMVKATYGTGCFALLNTGSIAVRSHNRLLTTIAYQLAGRRTYALEGSIFVAGAAVQWLRDGLQPDRQVVRRRGRSPPAPSRTTASTWCRPSSAWARPTGTPARAARCSGLTRDTGPAEIAAATLDSVCYQTRDLVDAMRGDGAQIDELRVDGGMVVNDLADAAAGRHGRPCRSSGRR